MSVIPQSISYSSQVKPVSVSASKSGVRLYLPTTSGAYTSTNNIIRIPIQSSGFLDMRNATLRYSLQQTTSNVSGYLDGSAIAPLRRLTIYSASGQQLSYVDNLNKLQNVLEDVEYNREVAGSYQSILQGTSEGTQLYTIKANGTANMLEFSLNNQIVDTLTLGTTKTIKVGDFQFSASATAGQLVITSLLDTTFSTATIVAGTASAGVSVNGIAFAGSATANSIIINGATIATGGVAQAQFQYTPPTGSGMNTSIINATTNTGLAGLSYPEYTITKRFFEVPVMNLLSSLNVNVPVFLSPVGYIFEFQLANDRDVFVPSNTSASCTYSIDDVAFHIPTIMYSPEIHQEMVMLTNKLGALQMTGVDYQCQIYNLGTASTASIPLGFKYRSMKSLMFFAVKNTTGSFDFTQSAREALPIANFQLQSGSSYYPEQPVLGAQSDPVSGNYTTFFRSRDAEIVAEMLKGVSKLSDIRLGSRINSLNFGLPQAYGGKSVYMLDLESSPANAFLRSGIDNSTTAEQLYLNLNLSGTPANAITLYMFACFDADILVKANRDVDVSK